MFQMKYLIVVMKNWTKVKCLKKKILVMKMMRIKILSKVILIKKIKILKILMIMYKEINNYNRNNSNFSKNILINNQLHHFNRILISVKIPI